MQTPYCLLTFLTISLTLATYSMSFSNLTLNFQIPRPRLNRFKLNSVITIEWSDRYPAFGYILCTKFNAQCFSLS